MKETDKAYAAGIIDGEGGVCLIRPRKARKFKYPIVSVTSTTPSLVDFMQTTFGGRIRTKKFVPGWKQAYEWKIGGDNCLEMLRYIFPYLREDTKVHRANLLIKEYKQVTPRNGKYSIEAEQRKLDFQERFFSV